MRDKDREFICFFQVGGYSFSFVLIRKRKNQLVFFDIFCIFVNETVTYYKIYQLADFRGGFEANDTLANKY